MVWKLFLRSKRHEKPNRPEPRLFLENRTEPKTAVFAAKPNRTEPKFKNAFRTALVKSHVKEQGK